MTAIGSRVARAATAYVDEADSRQAGAEAVARALAVYGPGAVDGAKCFNHCRHEGEQVLSGVRSQLPTGTAVVGGTAMGVVTNDDLGYEGHQVGVPLLGLGDEGCARLVAATGLGLEGEAAVGARLATAAAAGGDVDALLFLYSSIRRGIAHPEGFSLNFATPLAAALAQGLPRQAVIAGAGLVDSHQPQRSHVFGAAGPDSQGAVALALSGGVRMDVEVLHGCRPAGVYRTITRTDGPVVLEIDGRSALEVIDQMVAGVFPRDEYPLRVILGVNRGDRFAAFREEDYQTRLCLAVDEPRGGLVMFEPDLRAGSQVQLMRVSDDLSYVDGRVAALLRRLDGRRPLLALYLDCAGRSGLGSGMEEEEADAVRRALGDIPLLGVYTGVEVAQIRGDLRPLDWTGVLCVLST
jgi:small ligand-binding sensory domain FIST